MDAVGGVQKGSERPWCRPHKATVTIGLVLIFAAAVRNFDGGVMSAQDFCAEEGPSLKFGWPFVFAVRTWKFTRPLMGEGQFLLLDAGSINGVADTTTEVNYWVVVGNVSLVALVLMGTTLGFERIIRLSATTFRFSVRELLALIGFLGTLLWFYHGRSAWEGVYCGCGIFLTCAVGLAWHTFFCHQRAQG